MLFAQRMQERLYQFALAVIASRRGRSHAEWLAKLSVVVEELDEADHWLAMLHDAGIASAPQNLITECKQLVAILTRSVETARKNRPNP